MGKKTKRVEPDADGYLNSGIYRRRVKKPKQTPAERDAAFQSICDACGKPEPNIVAWLDEMTQGMIESISGFIVRDAKAQPGKEYHLVPTLDGPWWRIADGLPTSDEEYVRDVMDALNKILVLKHHIATDNTLAGNLVWVVQNAFKLGQIVERMKVRPFEPLVMAGVVRRDSQIKGGHSTAKLKSPQEQNLALDLIAKYRTFGVSDTAACVRAAADLNKLHGIEVGKDTLLKLLRESK